MPPSQLRLILIFAALLALITSAAGIANFVIEYQWWSEVEQIPTWFSILLYKILPAAAASLLA